MTNWICSRRCTNTLRAAGHPQGSRICEKGVTNQAVEHEALSRAWILDRLMRHAQVCLGEIPLRLTMRKARSTEVTELETHLPEASAAAN